MSEATNIEDVSYFQRYNDSSNNILFYYTNIKLDVYVRLTSYMDIYIKNGNDLVIKHIVPIYIDKSKELYSHIKCLRDKFEKYIKDNGLDKYGN